MDRASMDIPSTGGLEGSCCPPLLGWDKCILWDTGLSREAGQGGVICFSQKGERKCFGVHYNKQNFDISKCAQLKMNM